MLLIFHKCVESIKEIPKLKFILCSKAIGKQVQQAIGEAQYILQEFQYGNDIVQTTTTNVSVSGGCVISCLKTSFVGYGNIE